MLPGRAPPLGQAPAGGTSLAPDTPRPVVSPVVMARAQRAAGAMVARLRG